MAEHNNYKKLSDQEVEYMLAKAVAQQVPDIYEEASSTPITPLAMVDDIVPRQYPIRRRNWRRLAAACVLLILCAGGLFSWLWFSTKAVVSIDVNPSVALSLNRFSYVIDTQANNNDGAEVLDDLSIKNLKLDTALDALIGAMSRKGYLSDNAQISVFVDGGDDHFNQEIYEEVTEDLAHLAPTAVTQQGSSAQTSDAQQGSSTQTPTAQQGNSITTEQAKEIAVQHAGLQMDAVTFHSVEMEWDDGQQIYDVEFYDGTTEYDYNIDATTGKVLSFDHDVENFSIPQSGATTSPAGTISREQAQQAALERAGLSGETVRWDKVELDQDDGRSIYELEFAFSNSEYECEVDATTGEIVKFEQD